LYAGTEFGLFVSFDNGGSWQGFQLNLPVTPVTDVRVHRQDLVLSTMGRGFWILDNVTPLHLAASALTAGVAPSRWVSGVLAPRTAWRTRHQAMGSGPGEPQYPPPGTIVDYYVAERLGAGAIRLEILDAGGRTIRTFASASPAASAQAAGFVQARRRGATPVRLSTTPGLHRITWDLRHGADAGEPRGGPGPLAVPGKYMVRFTAGETVETKAFELRLDPRAVADGVTQADLEEQFALLSRIQEASSRARQAATRAQDSLERVPAGDTARAAALREILSRLVTAGGPYPQPMLIDQLATLGRMAGSADMKVGRSAFEYLEELNVQLAALEASLAGALGKN